MLQYSGAAITKLAEKWHGLGLFSCCFFFFFFFFSFFFLFLFSISWKCVKILTFECHTLHSACEIKDISLKETYAPCSLFWFPVQLVTMHLHFVHTFGSAARAVLLRKGCKLFSSTFLEAAGRCLQPAMRGGMHAARSLLTASPVTHCLLPQWLLLELLGWLCRPPAGERLFAGAFPCCPISLPSQPASWLPNFRQWQLCLYPSFSPTSLHPLLASGKCQKSFLPCLELLWEALKKCWQPWKPCV